MRESMISQDEAQRILVQVKHLQEENAQLKELVHKLKAKDWVDFMTSEERPISRGWNDYMAGSPRS